MISIIKSMPSWKVCISPNEPTNYISLDVLEAFESAIIRFPGPVMAISHDRWFMQRFGGQVWELSNGKLVKHDDAQVVVS